MIRPCQTEHDAQCALVHWCDLVGVPILAIPNGGSRHIATAVKLRREGVRAGVPDLFIPLARQGKHGLWIEMKRERGGRLSPSQRLWHDLLRANGYEVVVCHGFDSARTAVADYTGTRIAR